MQAVMVHEGLYIKEAAAIVGVSTTVLRLWERHGLLAPSRSPSGYRLYTADDVSRAKQARDLIQRDGMSIEAARRNLGDEITTDGSKHSIPERRLGERLKALRAARHTSLRELADATGLSASYISSLERSSASPSVASLQKLASGLGTNLLGLIGGEQETESRVVVSAGERTRLQLEIPGVLIENMSATKSVLEPLLFHVEPGAGSDTSYSHRGEEFLYVLQGTFEMTLDETQVFTLVPGDAMTFASHRPHRWWNPGDNLAIVVWINTPPTF
jgi:DNA-binding transcriptional MerR regulator/quercetin dioxygenase-like cupin family protein